MTSAIVARILRVSDERGDSLDESTRLTMCGPQVRDMAVGTRAERAVDVQSFEFSEA